MAIEAGRRYRQRYFHETEADEVIASSCGVYLAGPSIARTPTQITLAKSHADESQRPVVRGDGISHSSLAANTSITRPRPRLRKEVTLHLGDLHRCRAFLVIIRNMIDSSAHGITPHQPSIVGL